jgi:hypothetical protein
LLNISVSLQTVFAAITRLAGDKFLREEPTINKGKSSKFRAGTGMPIVSNNNNNNNNNDNSNSNK